MPRIFRATALATLIAGTLDILMAIVDTSLSDGSVPRMLGSIASGPFGDGIRESSVAAPLGLLVHFAIMTVMAAAYVLASPRISALNRYWWIAGPLYGLGLWFVMYWLVLPLRFGAPLPSDPIEIAKGLFAHCILVGLPIAWIARRRDSARI